MNITESEDRLFKEWEAKIAKTKGDFVRDGVVCEEVFLREKVKLVFILKEANDLYSSYKSLSDFLKDGAGKNGGHTWNPICRWVDESFKCGQSRSEVLKRIVALNLKKKDEKKTTTDMLELRMVARRDKDFIRRQLDIYSQFSPVIFVCCGTGMFDIVAEEIYGINTANIDHNKKPTTCSVGDKTWLLAFNHPNSRVKDLCALFRRYCSVLLEKTSC
jgi:hypothetical protein